jgi:hypothetical protein
MNNQRHGGNLKKKIKAWQEARKTQRHGRNFKKIKARQEARKTQRHARNFRN